MGNEPHRLSFATQANAARQDYTFSSGLERSTGMSLLFDERRTRSETVHVNQIGYVPSAPQKLAYLSAWLGDMGPLSLDEYSNQQFHLVDAKSGKVVFSGKPALRQRLTEADSLQPNDGPNNNFTGADLWQCDFSAFKTPGQYVLSVDGIGCSFPFPIGEDVYRQAFTTTARGLTISVAAPNSKRRTRVGRDPFATVPKRALFCKPRIVTWTKLRRRPQGRKGGANR
jgi:hypothetical protein